MLVEDKETANRHEPAPVLGSEPPVSVVSGVSSEVDEWIHDEGYTCDECGGHRERLPGARALGVPRLPGIMTFPWHQTHAAAEGGTVALLVVCQRSCPEP